MDPTSTYRDFLTAIRNDDHDTAGELAKSLADWLEHGGCWPERCSPTVLRACLEKVLGRSLTVTVPHLPPLFPLGEIVITANAHDVLNGDDVNTAIRRHHHGDWGELEYSDRVANEAALTGGLRLLSVYHAHDGTKFYVITEADRSSTCVLLPEDY